MKITLISNLYEPYQRGGAERVAQLQVEGLKRAGHEVIVISTKPKGKLDVEEKDNVKYYRFKPMNLFYYLNDYKHNILTRLLYQVIDTFNFWSANTVKKILSKEKPDVVITHNLKGLSLQVPKVIKQLKLKHYHVLHDVQLAVPSGLLYWGKENAFIATGWPTKVYQSVCKKIFNQVDRVISPSAWLMKYYQDLGYFTSSEKEVLPNPFEIDFSPKPKEVRTRKFLFVGQIEEHKGINWLIDFWEKNNIENELLIVGTGQAKLKVTNDKIKLLGYKRGEELSKIFAQVDFMILPSLVYENSPTVIQLALANATPVITARIGGAPELIEKGETGYIFTPAGNDDLAAILSEVNSLSDDDYHKMSENCLMVAKNYNLSAYISKISALK